MVCGSEDTFAVGGTSLERQLVFSIKFHTGTTEFEALVGGPSRTVD